MSISDNLNNGVYKVQVYDVLFSVLGGFYLAV